MGQFWGELARRLADDHLLSFDVEAYGSALEGYQTSILDGYGDLMKSNGLEGGLSRSRDCWHGTSDINVVNWV